ncbi:MAG: prepilin-type N-terminal cleavage/methylation domain-containing protein [Candidatus Hydrogenedens sp.]|nr:prepilin-type N-terminal cleavage/methylation domain-containing protein [Candidatus Hydrogenedens sp.]
MSNARGYTLLETMVVVAVMGGIFAITGTVLVRSAKVWHAEETFAAVSNGMRDAAMAISRDLQFARLEADLTQTPPVIGVTLGKGDIQFQMPQSADGNAWSPVVMFRLNNEDKNGNLRLDSGEDLDQDGILDRCIERVQDIDGDGKYEGDGEVRVVARGIDRLSFQQEPGSTLIEVAIEARVPDPGRENVPQVQSNRFSVRVSN